MPWRRSASPGSMSVMVGLLGDEDTAGARLRPWPATSAGWADPRRPTPSPRCWLPGSASRPTPSGPSAITGPSSRCSMRSLAPAGRSRWRCSAGSIPRCGAPPPRRPRRGGGRRRRRLRRGGRRRALADDASHLASLQSQLGDLGLTPPASLDDLFRPTAGGQGRSESAAKLEQWERRTRPTESQRMRRRRKAAPRGVGPPPGARRGGRAWCGDEGRAVAAEARWVGRSRRARRRVRHPTGWWRSSDRAGRSPPGPWTSLGPDDHPGTRFGGQPTWLDAPTWPVAASGVPLSFWAQIRLPDEPDRMAYLFVDRNSDLMDAHESSVFVQPGGGPASAWVGEATGPVVPDTVPRDPLLHRPHPGASPPGCRPRRRSASRGPGGRRRRSRPAPGTRSAGRRCTSRAAPRCRPATTSSPSSAPAPPGRTSPTSPSATSTSTRRRAPGPSCGTATDARGQGDEGDEGVPALGLWSWWSRRGGGRRRASGSGPGSPGGLRVRRAGRPAPGAGRRPWPRPGCGRRGPPRGRPARRAR